MSRNLRPNRVMGLGEWPFYRFEACRLKVVILPLLLMALTTQGFGREQLVLRENFDGFIEALVENGGETVVAAMMPRKGAADALVFLPSTQGGSLSFDSTNDGVLIATSNRGRQSRYSIKDASRMEVPDTLIEVVTLFTDCVRSDGCAFEGKTDELKAFAGDRSRPSEYWTEWVSIPYLGDSGKLREEFSIMVLSIRNGDDEITLWWQSIEANSAQPIQLFSSLHFNFLGNIQ